MGELDLCTRCKRIAARHLVAWLGDVDALTKARADDDSREAEAQHLVQQTATRAAAEAIATIAEQFAARVNGDSEAIAVRIAKLHFEGGMPLTLATREVLTELYAERKAAKQAERTKVKEAADAQLAKQREATAAERKRQQEAIAEEREKQREANAESELAPQADKSSSPTGQSEQVAAKDE